MSPVRSTSETQGRGHSLSLVTNKSHSPKHQFMGFRNTESQVIESNAMLISNTIALVHKG